MKDLLTLEEAIKAWSNGQRVGEFCERLGLYVEVPPLSDSTEQTPRFSRSKKYGLAPLAIMIGGEAVPMPLNQAPSIDDTFWAACPTSEFYAIMGKWNGSELQMRLLENKLLHLSRGAANCHASALIRASVKASLTPI